MTFSHLKHKYFVSFVRAFALCALCMLIYAGPVQAATPTANVAVVDVQKLMTDSKAAQSIQKQIETKRQQYQQEFSKHEEELRNSEKSLAEARGNLSAEEFNDRRQDFENKLLETRKLVQKRRRALEKAAAAALAQLRNKVVGIVATIADDQKIDLVITRQNIILVDKDLDITAQVLKQLDSSLSKIELKVETE